MKAICTFLPYVHAIGLKKDQRYEIIFAENLENHHILVNTPLGRLEYRSWADFHQQWQVDLPLDGTVMPE